MWPAIAGNGGILADTGGTIETSLSGRRRPAAFTRVLVERPFDFAVAALTCRLRRPVVGRLREALSKGEERLVVCHPCATRYRFEAQVVDALQASLASYLGHLKRAACRRQVTALRARHAWQNTCFEAGKR